MTPLSNLISYLQVEAPGARASAQARLNGQGDREQRVRELQDDAAYFLVSIALVVVDV